MSKIALLTAFALTLTVIGGCMADEKAPGQKKIDISKLPAFPGAEGYGAQTVGGRGGKVFAVTNLNDSGPGSLRAAVEAEGPRTVVFRVSGTIALDSPLHIRQPNLTIAGQTAPGDGICIRRYPLMIRASDIIIRYIRVRFGDESGTDADAISGRYFKNIILDHVSASWSVDETVSIYHCENVTIQWCLISESLHYSKQSKGVHGFGAIWGSNYATHHHNLLAHHSSRNPRFASGCGYNDYRNNVVYNWGYNSCYGGEARQGKENRNPPIEFSTINMVANYYKPGPATAPGDVSWRIVNPSTRKGVEDLGKWYVADNYVHGSPAVTADNWNGGVQVKDQAYLPAMKLDKPWDAMPIRQQTAEEAYHAVLKMAGASLPKRDAVDARIIEETRTGTATYEGPSYRKRMGTRFTDSTGKLGIIDSQDDVGGWPELKSLPAPADTDGDGMPDEWEKKYGFDSASPSDGVKDADGDGYTNVEEYINGTDPKVFVDYTRPENNSNTLHLNVTNADSPQVSAVVVQKTVEAAPAAHKKPQWLSSGMYAKPLQGFLSLCRGRVSAPS